MASDRPAPDLRSNRPLAVSLYGGGAGLLLGLCASRLLFEGGFPATRFFGSWPGALLLALFGGIGGILAGRALLRKTATQLTAASPFIPLILNLIWLADPAVDVARGRLYLWLTVTLALYLGWRAWTSTATWHRRAWPHLLWLWLGLLPLYLLTMPETVGRADTFEFQVVTPGLGIVHPTGYPLYLLVGKLLTTLLPDFASFAWQLNLVTMLYGLGAVSFVYLIGKELLADDRPAWVAALIFGLTPTFWSQAIEAEIYSLHLLFVGAVLWLVISLLSPQATFAAGSAEDRSPGHFRLRVYLLPFLIGLGLTNHLTTVFLIPPALLALYFVRKQLPLRRWRFWLGMAAAGLLPLLLYAYLPLRWAAVNNEPMGLERFIDWVIGGRFRGSLQWGAWLQDAGRYAIVGRLLRAEWGVIGLGAALLGWLWLLKRSWRVGLALLLAWLGFIFYTLNYHVPDLSVFILPAQFIVAVGWSGAPAALLGGLARMKPGQRGWSLGMAALLTVGLILPLAQAARLWPEINRRHETALTEWAEGVLSLPLVENGAVLADSEKIAPLLYLQRAEGWRPDLDIVVLPDEAAYRAQIGERLAAAQAVYLARFVPGLEGIYHLNSMGPLLAVSEEPGTSRPLAGEALDLAFGDIQLLAAEIEPVSPYDPDQTSLTLFWTTDVPIEENRLIYLRWNGETMTGQPQPPAGQHAAANYYPAVAWEPGEIVADFHTLPRPILSQPQPLIIEVALGPPFANVDELAWQPVASLPAGLPQPANAPSILTRMGESGLAIVAADVPAGSRPNTPVTALLQGIAPGNAQAAADVIVLSENGDEVERVPFTFEASDEAVWQPIALPADLSPGEYEVWLELEEGDAMCGWLRTGKDRCFLGEIAISGVAIPPDAVNYADTFALLDVALSTETLEPGKQLEITLQWQALASVRQNYTVFIQVLDANDRVVGQADSWPVQGTFPTSQWQPGEVVSDRHQVILSEEMPPGAYHIYVGWYLLGTLERLPVLNEQGQPVDDKLTIPNLVVQ